MNEKIRFILKELNNHLVDKEEVVRLSLLAFLSGENILFQGKSGSIRNITQNRIALLHKEKPVCFTYYINEKTEASEISNSTCTVQNSSTVFLDGIFNGESKTLNEIMNILSSGNCPVFAVDSDFPSDKSYDSLYDQFALRLQIKETGGYEKFLEMANSKSDYKINIPEGYLFTSKKLNYIRSQIPGISINKKIENIIFEIRRKLFAEKISLSDQRWQSIFNLLKTSAYLNERNEIDLMDLQIIEYCIWGKELSFEKARAIVEDSVRENGISLESSVTDVSKIHNDLNIFSRIIPKKNEDALQVVLHNELEYFSFVSDIDGKLFRFKRNPSGYNDSDYIPFYNEDFSKTTYAYINQFDLDRKTIIYSFTDGIDQYSGKLLVKDYFLNFDEEIEEHYKSICSAIEEKKNQIIKTIEKETKKYSSNLFADSNFVSFIQAQAQDNLSVYKNLKLIADQIKESYGK